ncbi:hypothetical protein [uncultured Tenacibaculum sp.]|uniref:hypothetical protein n=1 Tax=uncultured Tenacibaculum sp. TaxID=174713 RepID=UPI00260369D1|nr:hypothetical protein [uncultured Tenacibaculum sp.]
MGVIKKIIVVLVLLFSFLLNAQNEKLPSYFSNELQLNQIELSEKYNNGFQVRLQQTNSTIISLKQIGNENIANIDNKLAQGKHKVYQIGNQNNYQFLNYRNNQQINLGILQTGNANSLKIIGTNSMFSNLKITQFGGASMNIINY